MMGKAMSARRRRALEALAKRGATEGERTAAAKALGVEPPIAAPAPNEPDWASLRAYLAHAQQQADARVALQRELDEAVRVATIARDKAAAEVAKCEQSPARSRSAGIASGGARLCVFIAGACFAEAVLSFGPFGAICVGFAFVAVMRSR